MPRVMLLIPSRSYRAPDFMDAASKLGVEVVVGSDARNPLDGTGDGRTVALDFADPEHGADQVEAFALLHPLDTIVAVDDAGALLAARASRRLELPHNSVTAVEATRNKYVLRERLAKAGVPSPPYWLFGLEDDAREAAGKVEYPVVLKPLALSASKGVIRADVPEQFVAAFERIGRILATPEAEDECGTDLLPFVLAEGYVPGVEVSVEGLLDAGRLRVLALFDKPDPLEGPYFEETIYVTPSRLPEAEQRRIVETTERACAALGLQHGPVHAELRLNDGGAYPVDIAARSIGGLCSRTLTFGTGMSLEEIILRHAVQGGVPEDERDSRAAGVMMIPIPAAGTLRAVEGRGDAEAVPLIESVTITMRPGDRVVPLPEGSEYLGFIFARGDTPEAVESALREAHRRLRFEIE